MSAIKIEDLSVVKLKDGRTGTIVYRYENNDKVVCIEIDDAEHTIIDVSVDDIENVIWSPNN